jgi:tetratricopeptide (TPR) repeat protein
VEEAPAIEAFAEPEIAATSAQEAEIPEIEIVEEAAPAAHVPQEVAAAPSEPEEVDLSDEWASLLEETQPAPQETPASAPKAAAHPPAAEPHAPEVQEFEIPEFQIEEAKDEEPAAPASPSTPHVAAKEEPAEEFAVPVDNADSTDWGNLLPDADQPAEHAIHEQAHESAPVEEPAAEEFEVGQHHQELLPEEEVTELPIPAHAEIASEEPEPALEVPQATIPHAHAAPPKEEFEQEQDFELVLEPEEIVPPHEMLSQMPATPPPAEAHHAPEAKKDEPVTQQASAGGFASDAFLSDLAKEIDDLGLDTLTPPAPGTHEPAHQPPAAEPVKETVSASPENAPLKEVFDEFRAELGEMGAEDEDLETHYNLGIAFREMGLLEEAIGEFQKVAKANDRGKVFRYAMQCSTLLGLAFMEKGQPDIAAIWYERALTTPGLDSESKLALRYDLGVAQESAGDLEAALKSFSQVYAINIDYRDVAERIAALQKPAR